MIPVRRRAILPPGHWYLIHQPDHGHLTVTVSALIPAGSDLEQALVRDAVTAWRRHQRRGLTLTPGLITTPGGWAWRGARHHMKLAAGIAAGAVAAGGLALALTGPDAHPRHQPPAAVAPPTGPTAPPPAGPTAAPSPRTPPDRPGHPGPSPTRPEAPAGLRVEGPGGAASTPPSRPGMPQSAAEQTSGRHAAGPSPSAGACLVEAHAWKLTRVCL